MAAPVYTTPILIGSPSGPITELVVPTGYLYVIRDVSGVVFDALSASEAFAVAFDGVNPTVFFSASQALTAGDSFHWEGRVAAPEGSKIQGASGSILGSINYIVSGYALTLP